MCMNISDVIQLWLPVLAVLLSAIVALLSYVALKMHGYDVKFEKFLTEFSIRVESLEESHKDHEVRIRYVEQPYRP